MTFANYRSENPLPVLLKIGANVDASYDVQIKNFVHEGIEYIGVLMLCPNPGPEIPGQIGAAREGNRLAPSVFGALLEHDPEKWEPVFRKDHAQTRRWTTSMIQLS